MSNKFKIHSIGIEFEFDITHGFDSNAGIAREYVRNFNSENPKFQIDFDKEYYSSQIEFKLRRTEDIKLGVETFQKFIRGCYDVFFDINATAKPYVGTHIHFFLEKNGKPYELMARGKKMPIASFTYEYFTSFLSNNNYKLKSRILSREADRLARNHNILRYFDKQSLNDGIRKQLEENGMEYPMFHRGIDRPKYTPVLWSLKNEETGKPHSLEVRAIPNVWFLIEDSSEIIDYIYGIESILNHRFPRTTDFVSDILSNHRRLISIVKSNDF